MKTQKPRKAKGLSTWVEFTQIGIQMGITITAGVLLGVWLDKKYSNNHQAYTIICSLFGVFASLYMVIKKVLSMAKKEEKKTSDESKK